MVLLGEDTEKIPSDTTGELIPGPPRLVAQCFNHYDTPAPNTVRNTQLQVKIKVKVKQCRYRPGVAQRVPGSKVPRFHDNGTGWW